MSREIVSEAPTAVLLDVEVIEILDKIARERGMSRSSLLREIIYQHLGIERKDDEPRLNLDLEEIGVEDILLSRSDRYRWLRLTLTELYPETSSVLEMRCPYCGRRFRARRYVARHITRGIGLCQKIFSKRVEEAKKIYSELLSVLKLEKRYRGKKQVEVYIVPNPSCPPGRRCGEKEFEDLEDAIKYFISRKKSGERPRRRGPREDRATDYLQLD